MTIESRRLQVFVATKGHAFDRNAFEAMLRSAGVEPTMVDQPAAAMLLNPDAMRGFDAILFYDMAGMDFRAPLAERPGDVAPTPEFAAGLEALLDAGKGIVALHHSIAGWPGWPLFGEMLGGRFLYRARGSRPDSGYATDQRYVAHALLPSHPVLEGIPDTFELTDEPYRFEVGDDVTPLLERDAVPPNAFQSAARAIRREEGPASAAWQALPDTPLLAWAHRVHNSRVVYIQPGDGPATFANEHYRRLVGNALRWVSASAVAD